MNRLILIFVLCCCIIPITTFAQERKFDFSTPVGFDPGGINKVLCMNNGNTMLFHFELGKPIMLKVFDTAHKRVANTEHLCKELDISMLKTMLFKGLYDINGEAVLFIEQENNGRHSLVRLRFNSHNGKMIEEKTMGRSRSMAKPMKFFVMKNKGEDNYAILYSTDIPQFKDCELHVTYYNAKHESYKEVPLTFDRKKFDYLDVVSAESLPAGVCVSLGLSTLLLNGTANRVKTASLLPTVQQYDDLSYGVTSSLENASVYSHHYGMFFIGQDSSRAVSHFVDVSTEVYPYYACSTYNPFAKSVNLLMLSYQDVFYRFGLELRPTAIMGNLFFKLDDENLAADYTWITNKLAGNVLKSRTDTANNFKGLPVAVFTNANGLSTMVSQSFARYKNVESQQRADVFETYFGDVAITQFDDDGKEIWGTVLPVSQYLKSYRHYYITREVSKKRQQLELFGYLHPQV
jgi:hypothetical protein